MNASGADIQLRQELQHLGYSLAIITGTPEASQRAKEMLQQQVGLMGGGHITKEIEVATDNRDTQHAVELALEELRKRKADDVPVRILHPEMPGSKVRVSIGPGSVAHVATTEQLIRKKLNGIELDLCYRQGRPVPIEKKVAIKCKYFNAGSCPQAQMCQYCHGDEELAVAQRASLPSGANTAAMGGNQRALPAPPPIEQRQSTSGLI